MRRNSIYLINKLSEKEQDLLKTDLIEHSIQTAIKIKNLTLTKECIEEIVKNAVERVMSTYKFSAGNGLGDMVKAQVISDLKAEYERAYPGQANKVLWPDLDKRKPFDRLLEALQKVKLLPKAKVKDIFEKVNANLIDRQQKLLLTIYANPSITYAEISKQFGKRGVMTYREVQIIYTHLTDVLKNLEILI